MKTLRLYCDVVGCKKTFRNQESLEIHVENEHANSNQECHDEFKCQYCNKNLSTKQSLKEHLYTHTGEKPYKCLEAGCGLLFRQSSQLSNHKKVHSEIKKNTPENTKINLASLSRLFSAENIQERFIPSGPYTLVDALLPELRPNPLVTLRIIEGLQDNL